jgi:hypothetical protein
VQNAIPLLKTLSNKHSYEERKMKFLALALLLVGFQAQASSFRLDSEPLRTCGGYVSLNETYDGDLSLQFRNTYCENITIKDASNGRVLAQYSMAKGGRTMPYTASYTLSKRMRGELSRDLELDFTVSGHGGRDKLVVVIPGNGQHGGHHGGNGGHQDKFTTGYGRTNSGKCAYYFLGKFQNHASEYECRIRGI